MADASFSATASTPAIVQADAQPEDIISQACVTCHILKPLSEYNQKDGCYYPNCQDCFFNANALFWSTKHFKFCVGCQVYVSLREYDFSNGSPFPRCRKCYAAELTGRKFDREREEERRKAAVEARHARPVVAHNDSQVQGGHNDAAQRARVVQAKPRVYDQVAPTSHTRTTPKHQKGAVQRQ